VGVAWDEKREIPEYVGLSRTVSDLSLFVENRNPFGFLAHIELFKHERHGRLP